MILWYKDLDATQWKLCSCEHGMIGQTEVREDVGECMLAYWFCKISNRGISLLSAECWLQVCEFSSRGIQWLLTLERRDWRDRMMAQHPAWLCHITHAAGGLCGWDLWHQPAGSEDSVTLPWAYWVEGGTGQAFVRDVLCSEYAVSKAAIHRIVCNVNRTRSRCYSSYERSLRCGCLQGKCCSVSHPGSWCYKYLSLQNSTIIKVYNLLKE